MTTTHTNQATLDVIEFLTHEGLGFGTESGDVAGLVGVRIDHDLLAGLAELLRVLVDHAAELRLHHARLGPLAADWETQTRAAFLAAYDQTARQAGLDWAAEEKLFAHAGESANQQSESHEEVR